MMPMRTESQHRNADERVTIFKKEETKWNHIQCQSEQENMQKTAGE